MTEIPDLPEAAEVDVTDDDLVILYDVSAGSNNSRKATRARFLKDVVRTTGTSAAGTINATAALNAPAGAIQVLTVDTRIVLGANLSKVLVGSASVALGDAATQVEVTATMTLTGALVGDLVTLHAPSTFPAGMMLRATVTDVDEVTVYAFNASSLTIIAASYALTALAFRVT